MFGKKDKHQEIARDQDKSSMIKIRIRLFDPWANKESVNVWVPRTDKFLESARKKIAGLFG